MSRDQQISKGLEKDKAGSLFWRLSEMLSLGCTGTFWAQGRGPDALYSRKWLEAFTAVHLLSRELLVEDVC